MSAPAGSMSSSATAPPASTTASAIAAPIPRAAPVTSTDLPSSAFTTRQWLSRGTPLLSAIRWYLTAGFSTIPCDSSSTMPRWISCHGVWCSGYA